MSRIKDYNYFQYYENNNREKSMKTANQDLFKNTQRIHSANIYNNYNQSLKINSNQKPVQNYIHSNLKSHDYYSNKNDSSKNQISRSVLNINNDNNNQYNSNNYNSLDNSSKKSMIAKNHTVKIKYENLNENFNKINFRKDISTENLNLQKRKPSTAHIYSKSKNDLDYSIKSKDKRPGHIYPTSNRNSINLKNSYPNEDKENSNMNVCSNKNNLDFYENNHFSRDYNNSNFTSIKKNFKYNNPKHVNINLNEENYNNRNIDYINNYHSNNKTSCEDLNKRNIKYENRPISPNGNRNFSSIVNRNQYKTENQINGDYKITSKATLYTPNNIQSNRNSINFNNMNKLSIDLNNNDRIVYRNNDYYNNYSIKTRTPKNEDKNFSKPLKKESGKDLFYNNDSNSEQYNYYYSNNYNSYNSKNNIKSNKSYNQNIYSNNNYNSKNNKSQNSNYNSYKNINFNSFNSNNSNNNSNQNYNSYNSKNYNSHNSNNYNSYNNKNFNSQNINNYNNNSKIQNKNNSKTNNNFSTQDRKTVQNMPEKSQILSQKPYTSKSNIKGNHSTKLVKDYSYKEEKNDFFRETMEDCTKIIDNFLNDNNKALFCAYDGHGSSEPAKFSRDRFSQIFSKFLTETNNNIQKSFISTFQKIDDEMKIHLDCENIGTTACIVYILKEKDTINGERNIIYCANTGDTRCVLLTKNGSKRLSYDHKCSDESEVARIKKAGGVVFSGRVFGQLAVSRALGDHAMKKLGVICTPYISKHIVSEKDKWILICSDGVWDVMSDEDIFDLSHKIKSSEEFACTVVKLAIEKGSRDNISCIVVKIN